MSTIERDKAIAAAEQRLSALLEALEKGSEAVRAILNGSAPDATSLDQYAEAMNTLRLGIIVASGINPGEEHISAARRLAELVRAGAAPKELEPLANRLLEVTLAASPGAPDEQT